MRDVTDNVTGELDVEVRRGRGRPRKADALSNSERQAAYRARRRAERVSPMHRPVVDEEALLDVADLEDDMAELRAELDATKAELAEAHETIDELNDELIPLRAMKDRIDEAGEGKLISELELALAESRQHRQDLIEGNQDAFATIAMLRAELAKLKGKKIVTRKAVTKKGA